MLSIEYQCILIASKVADTRKLVVVAVINAMLDVALGRQLHQ